jgi:XRE family transcriptional regulator, regulator of sulfur utilization
MTLKDIRNKLIEKFGDRGALSVPYLSEVERGISTPSIKTLEKMAQAFDISLYDFLSGVEWEKQDIDIKIKSLPPKSQSAFNEFREMVKGIEDMELNEYWINTLLKIEYRGKQPETKMGWYDIYRALKNSLNDKT